MLFLTMSRAMRFQFARLETLFLIVSLLLFLETSIVIIQADQRQESSSIRVMLKPSGEIEPLSDYEHSEYINKITS